MILLLAGVVLYAFLKAHRENLGQVPSPAGTAPAERWRAVIRQPAVMMRMETEMTFNVASEAASSARSSCTDPAWNCPG